MIHRYITPKTILQIILAVKWLVRNYSMSPNQQQQCLPAFLSDSYLLNGTIWRCAQIAGSATKHTLTQLCKGVLACVGAVYEEVVTRLIKGRMIDGRSGHCVFRTTAAPLPVEAVLGPCREHAVGSVIRLELVGQVGVLGAVVADFVGQIAAIVRQIAELIHADAHLQRAWISGGNSLSSI